MISYVFICFYMFLYDLYDIYLCMNLVYTYRFMSILYDFYPISIYSDIPLCTVVWRVLTDSCNGVRSFAVGLGGCFGTKKDL